jgi:small subunit ribosomal protein S3
VFIRDFIRKTFSECSILSIEIKRRLNFLNIDIHIIKPTNIVGTDGNKLFDIRNKLSKLLVDNFSARDITFNIIEASNPDLNARALADFVRQQLEKRVPFRRVIKAAILKAQKAGAKGIKVQISGRLNGAEIARTEWLREGQVPLHTLRANIDYFDCQARVILSYTSFMF